MKHFSSGNWLHSYLYSEAARLVLFLAVLLTFALCMSGCGDANNQKVIGHASWAEHATSLKALKHYADFAVSGEITRVGPLVKPADKSFPYSEVALTVSNVLWNAHPQKNVPSTVTFHENGGKDQDGTMYIMEDDPLYQVGQHVVLFIEEYNPGKYVVAGGPTGRFVIENNSVKPIAGNGVQLPSNMNENTLSNSLRTAP